MNSVPIPAMTPQCVHDYLRELGSKWMGKGVVIELGSWLGASAHPLLEGLKEAGYDRPFYAYDRWQANLEQVVKAKNQGVIIQEGQDLLPLFLKNVTPVYNYIYPTRGAISTTIQTYPKEPIEICLFDAPKQEPIFTDAVRALSPYWIPGVTVLGLLDYYFYLSIEGRMREKFKAPVNFIEKHWDSFVQLRQWGPCECSCVFYMYVKKLGRL